jgi:sugar phosphate isomerase/epimerase
MNSARRRFVQTSLTAALGLPLIGQYPWSDSSELVNKIKISLQCVSYANKLLRGEMSILEFPKFVREDFNLEAAEYWNLPLIQRRRDPKFIKELNQRTSDFGLENTILLVDLIDPKTRESRSICAADPKTRTQAVEEHKEWIDVAKSIGCSSIRVNLWSEGMSATEVKKISSESLNKLLEYSNSLEMSIVIENHGGFTSDAAWLVDLMKSINHPNLGTLPDFGTQNFCIEKAPPKEGRIFSSDCIKQYDKYQGVEEMLPYAKGISAKSIRFDDQGEETNTNFERMIKLIKASSFEGYMSIEYEGALMLMFGQNPSDYLAPTEGIRATKKLIEKYL